jgi:thymidine kinase
VKPAAKISLGYSHMFAGKSMELVKIGGSTKATQHWAYLMIAVTPGFLQ